MTSTPAEQRALVTGVSGFAGKHLAAQLVASGWRVAGIANTRASGVTGVEEQKIDIADQAALEYLIGEFAPRAVFHLAAIVDTVTTPSVLELQRVNVLGVVAVTEAVRAAAPEARVIYPSSSFVYGSIAPEDNPVSEAQPLRPQTPYGAGKVAAEAIVRQYSSSTAPGNAVIARAFQHTGPGHTGAYALSDWAGQLAQIERSGEPGQIATGNLDVERDYLDVRDVAAAYVALAQHGESGQTYNVCSGEAVTMRSLLEGLIAAFGVDAEIVTDEARLRAVDQPRVVGDVSRLAADTGWSRKYSIEQTLADLAQFWRERGRL
ncbi:MAG: GDP-mannose 4,6-dehydratase [Solirubrobacterales bacterium]